MISKLNTILFFSVIIFSCNPLEMQFDDNEKDIEVAPAPGILIDPAITGDTIPVIDHSYFNISAKNNTSVLAVSVFINSNRLEGTYYISETKKLMIQKNALPYGIYEAQFDIYTTTGSGSLADLKKAEFYKYTFTKKLLFMELQPSPVKKMDFNVESGKLKISWTPALYDNFRNIKYQVYRDYAGISNELIYTSQHSSNTFAATDTTCSDIVFMGGNAKYRIKSTHGNYSVISEDFTFSDPQQPEFQIIKLPNDDLQFVFSKNPYLAASALFMIQRKLNTDFLNPYESVNDQLTLGVEGLTLEPNGQYKTSPISNFLGTGGDSYYRVCFRDSNLNIRYASISKSVAIGTKIDQFSGIKTLTYMPELNQYVVSGENSAVIDADNFSLIKQVNGHVMISEDRQFAALAETQPYIYGGYQINAVYTSLEYPGLSLVGSAVNFSSVYGKNIYSFDVKLLNTNEVATSYREFGADQPFSLSCSMDSAKVTAYMPGYYYDAVFSGDKKYAIDNYNLLYRIEGDQFILIGETTGQFIEGTELIIRYDFTSSSVIKENRSDLSAVKVFSNINSASTIVIYDSATENFMVQLSANTYTLIDGKTGSIIKSLSTAGTPVKLHNNNLFFNTGYVYKIQ